MQQESQSPEQFTGHRFARRVTIIALVLGALLLVLNFVLGSKIPHAKRFLSQQFGIDLAFLVLLTAGAYLVSRKYTQIVRLLSSTLESLRSRYTQLRESSGQVVMTFPLGADGTPETFSEVNTAISRFGYSEEDILGRTLRDLIAPERHADVDALLLDLQAQKQMQMDTQLLTKDGRPLPITIQASLDESASMPTVTLFIRDISDEKRIEESLREARATLRAITVASPMAVVTLDLAGNVQEWNKAAGELTGWQEYEVFGNPLPLFSEEGGNTTFREHCERVTRKEVLNALSLPCRHKEGHELQLAFSAVPMMDSSGEVTGVITMLVDMTRQHEEEAELDIIRRAQALSSEAKRAVFRAADEADMLRGICETVLQVGGYEQVWIGLAGEDALRTVRPAAWAGKLGDEVARVEVPTADNVRGSDPVEQAIRQGAAAVQSHLLTAPGKSPWLIAALNHGFDAVAVLPLLSGWRAFGVLVLYSQRSDAFTTAEIDLLTELADDLAYGIEAMRVREERRLADQALLVAARQWRSTFDAIAGPICVVDMTGKITRCNLEATRLFDRPFDKLLGKSLCKLLHGDSGHPQECLLNIVSKSCERTNAIMPFSDRWYSVTVDPILDDAGSFQGALHIMNDITEQKLADEEAKRNYARLQNIINETISTITKIAEMRDPYTSGHEQRVSHLACAIGRAMALPDDRVEGLRVAGMLHDIGKLYVPAEILSKSGKLTDAEFAVIKHHPQAGYEILRSIDFPWPVAELTRQHHERMDGSGYPRQLPGADIVLEARILAVADVVESMASHRTYRPARGLDEALLEIESGAGTKYDSDVVAACVVLFRENCYVLPQ